MTAAVPGFMMSVERILAVNSDLVTKVVVLALPFQFSTDPGTNPEPLTVKVNADPPGVTASGTRGWLITDSVQKRR